MPAFWLLPMFWYILAILTFVGITYKIPFIGRFVRQILPNKRIAVFVFAAAGLLVSGILASFLGGLGGAPTGAAVGTAGLQIASVDYKAGSTWDSSNVSIGEDTVRKNTAYIRSNDAGVDETSGKLEFDGNLTVVRADSSKAGSCKVTASVTAFKSPSDPSDVNSYKIVEETSAGELEVYLAENQATTSSQKQEFYLDFGEGVSTKTLGVVCEIDEQASDELNKYDTKNIVLTFCDGYKYTFEYMELDAAA